MKLNEVRKEDDTYYQGGFWIIGNSVLDILEGKFKIIGHRELSNYNGDYIDLKQSYKSLTHERLWRDEFGKDFNDNDEKLPYNFYPRGRVAIYKGNAIIHLYHLFNNPKIIDAVINYYGVNELNIKVEFNDQTQGSHYDFILE